MLYPNKISPGDTIGVVSMSSGTAFDYPERFERGISDLEKKGFKVKIGQNARNKKWFTAGTPEERIGDLETMFEDQEVKMIISSIGGHSAQQILENLNYDLIKENPKILVGYSDTTAILNAVSVKTGMVTYLGPAVMPQFGEFGGIDDYSWNYFRLAFMDQPTSYLVTDSEEIVDEHLRWGVEDSRRRKTIRNLGSKIFREGTAEGEIWGGNMGVLLKLAGTEYFPDLDGKILLLEDDEVETPASISGYLTQYRQMGILKRVKAVLIGRFSKKVGFREEIGVDGPRLGDLLDEAFQGIDFTVVYNMNFGHVDPIITLPIGGMGKITASKNGKVIFEIKRGI